MIEVAAGLSPRGWRFRQRYPELAYVEADLPGMAARKRRALERMGFDPGLHLVREVDVLREKGPGSLDELAGELDPAHGLAIVTEGLLGYLGTDDVRSVWRRFATVLGGFAGGVYMSDIHIGAVHDAAVRAFRVLLSLFVRGRVHLHFQSPDEVIAELRSAGFAESAVKPAAEVAAGYGARGHPAAAGGRAGRMAHILEASTTPRRQ